MPPATVALTPAQRVTAWFFLVVAALFLLQNLVGGATVHYMVETGGFFGIDLPRWLPYNLTRTWHLQLAIFFVATAYLAAGIFLAPLIAGREPRGQGLLSAVLLGALAVVVFGSLGGEYLELPRLAAARRRVVLRRAGLGVPRPGPVLDVPADRRAGALGGHHLPRAAAPPGRREPGQPALAVLPGRAVDPGVLRGRPAHPHADNFAIGDFWRFWVVHLWVEDFLELFTTMLVALIFVLMGIVSERFAPRVIYFDVMLYSVGGVVGTMHHCYFSGGPAEHMALGAFFSAAEVIPLTFLTVEAWSFLQLGARQQAAGGDAVPAPLGGAVPGLGRVLELPRRGGVRLPDQPAGRVSYYEIGTR